ncbi:hypothetical protein DWQ67_02030 [Galactobacter caseinivorans]|uniref:Uncharacterized protein n=1 Tax=Galactobacter caseinivorans TaxID=2676123 RepID=A0A496PME5_9MICC|nr:hypothetical protein DWQ67_02030 [Galactobacter caseinivorans]
MAADGTPSGRRRCGAFCALLASLTGGAHGGRARGDTRWPHRCACDWPGHADGLAAPARRRAGAAGSGRGPGCGAGLGLWHGGAGRGD